MSTSIRKKLIQLTYEWDPDKKSHNLTWVSDYPINVNGIVTKIFKAEHEYTAGDIMTLNGEEYTFTSLSGDAPRTKIFKADQYVPIAIDLDEKIIAYYSMSGGSGGGGGVINVTIPLDDWNEDHEYTIQSSDLYEDSTVVLLMEDGIPEEEESAIYNSNITATQTENSIILKYENKPTMDYHIQIVLL